MSAAEQWPAPSPAGNPRVSVVMPVHNAAAHLAAAIRSALGSDLRELEVIVVDDGSTDASLSIARSLEDERLTILTQPASGGPSRPRNFGIARARAPYVALLDADDELKPDKLSGAVAALEAHPQAGLAFGDYERIDATGAVLCASVLAGYPQLHRLGSRPWRGRWRVLPQAEFARGLLHENFIGTSGVVLRRSVLQRVGVFDEALNYSEDRDLWFRLAHACDALYRDAVGHSYRISAGGLTLRPGSSQDRQRIEVLRRERARWPAARERRQVDRLIAENLAGIAWDHRTHGRRLASIATFAQAFLTSPSPRWVRGALGSLWPQTPA
jgi:glycosyltransferase involved in cell wall biosynthesis